MRKSEYTRLARKDRYFIKGQKYTLLAHRENLTLEGKKSLKLLLAANKRLNTAYLLKESFGQLWSYHREGWARRVFDNWRASLKWQRLTPFDRFAAMIERHWEGIAAYCHPENKVALGFVEGLNNKIRVIQRRAYGLRDERSTSASKSLGRHRAPFGCGSGQPAGPSSVACTGARPVRAESRLFTITDLRVHHPDPGVHHERSRCSPCADLGVHHGMYAKDTPRLHCTTGSQAKCAIVFTPAQPGKAAVASWRDELAKGALGENLAHLGGLNPEAPRASCGEEDLKAIEGKLLPLINAAGFSSKDGPPDVRQLFIDKQAVEIGRALIAAKDQAAGAARAETLISFVNSLEQGIREELRLRCQTVIADISADIQAMWTILHPGEAIEDVRLYLPQDTNKAIDIGLKFHGIEQGSPRLTLSEGFRNSLGLWIFLAMAKREADKDRPVCLDDVVVSLDRNHRGMIAELLEKQFGGRQGIILTHDREWYTELRQQLDNKTWAFRTLLPYETPAVGIRWSHKTTTFDDSRAQLKDRPDSAGNDARKIMDVELALIAERLKIRLPYLRGDRNDSRMAHDFLERFVGDGKKCFQKRADKDYVFHTEATEAFAKADTLVVSWANRASHTFDVVLPEAGKVDRHL